VLRRSFYSSFLFLLTIFWIVESTPLYADEGKALRFAVASFQHETCTFCPGGDTGLEHWTGYRGPYVGDEVLTQEGYISGFVSALAEYPQVQLIGLDSPFFVFGGSSTSWNTEEVFEHYVDGMISSLKQQMPVDGVYLALHGALAVRNVPRPEAEIARRFREVLGPGVPIVASFDLHGNEDEAFLNWADMSFVTKRYPHYDAPLQGARSARALVKLASGSYLSTTATRRPGIITPTVVQWTGRSPYMDIMERARRWEAREQDVYVSVFLGFPWSDVPDVGATIQVMTNNNQVLADQIADDMADYMWRRRGEMFAQKIETPAAAVKLAGKYVRSGETPVVLADYSDRSGDATHILEQVVKQNLGGVLVATIRDENALQYLTNQEAKPGDSVQLKLGGFAGEASGSPVNILGKLQYLQAGLRYERVAVIEFGNNNAVIITPALEQIMWPRDLAFGPLNPADYTVFVVKSRVHFRRGFDESGFSKQILIVDAPGPYLGTVHLEEMPYEHVNLDEFYPYNEK